MKRLCSGKANAAKKINTLSVEASQTHTISVPFSSKVIAVPPALILNFSILKIFRNVDANASAHTTMTGPRIDQGCESTETDGSKTPHPQPTNRGRIAAN